MDRNSRDFSIISHMIDYCTKVEVTKKKCLNRYEDFKADELYQLACAMCILQIGELANGLSDEYKNMHQAIPWKEVRGMRNILAHRYGTLDIEVLWETITEDIPELERELKNLL